MLNIFISFPGQMGGRGGEQTGKVSESTGHKRITRPRFKLLIIIFCPIILPGRSLDMYRSSTVNEDLGSFLYNNNSLTSNTFLVQNSQRN